MHITARSTETATIARLIRAQEARRPVTLAYLKEEKDENGRRTGNLVETLRTVEIHDWRTTADGRVLAVAVVRLTGEVRTWRVDRIRAFAIHRIPAITEAPATGDNPRPTLRTVEAALTTLRPRPTATPGDEMERHFALLAAQLAA